MKFYNKRGGDISIDKSKTITELFYPISKEGYNNNEIFDEIKENYIFIITEDKNLKKFSDSELLELNINIVPHYKRQRFKYFFNDFNDMFNYFIKEQKFKSLIPYEGYDLF